MAAGVPCALPFTFQGRLQWDCIRTPSDRDGASFCRVTDGTWQRCAPLDTNLTRRAHASALAPPMHFALARCLAEVKQL